MTQDYLHRLMPELPGRNGMHTQLILASIGAVILDYEGFIMKLAQPLTALTLSVNPEKIHRARFPGKNPERSIALVFICFCDLDSRRIWNPENNILIPS